MVTVAFSRSSSSDNGLADDIRAADHQRARPFDRRMHRLDQADAPVWARSRGVPREPYEVLRDPARPVRMAMSCSMGSAIAKSGSLDRAQPRNWLPIAILRFFS